MTKNENFENLNNDKTSNRHCVPAKMSCILFWGALGSSTGLPFPTHVTIQPRNNISLRTGPLNISYLKKAVHFFVAKSVICFYSVTCYSATSACAALYHLQVFELWKDDPKKRTWVPIAPVNKIVDDGKPKSRESVLLTAQAKWSKLTSTHTNIITM